MNDLDTLRPEVAEALGFIERNQKYGDGSVCAGDIDIIRAELLRLAHVNSHLLIAANEYQDRAESAESELTIAHRERDRMFLDAREWATRFGEMEARAERAEAELAALKARMRPVARVENGEVRALMDPADEGKYVAVVVVEE